MMKTLLIFRTGQLGDTLVAIPAIIALRKNYPHHRLVLLTDVQDEKGYVSSWEILGPLGIFNDVIFYRPEVSRRKNILAQVSLLAKLRALKPDFVVSLMPVRNKIQAHRDQFFFKWLVGACRYSSGGVTQRPSVLANGRLPRVEPEWRRLLRISCGEVPNSNTCFPLEISSQDEMEIVRILSDEGIDYEGRLLAFGPGSKMPAKKWPMENYLKLGKRLLDQYSDITIVVFGGGKDEHEIGDKLVASWGRRTYNLIGKLSLYQAAAALQKCCCYIGNDTGTMHLAASVGTRCIALFSARDYPGLWEPFGSEHIILRHDTTCAGCMLVICNQFENECLKRIKIDEAYQATCRILDTVNCSTKRLSMN